MSTITLSTRNAYAVDGETVSTGILVDPESAGLDAGVAVELQPGNDYLVPARKDVALFMRNRTAGGTVSVSVIGGQRLDGARLKTLVISLSEDGGETVQALQIDPAYGNVVGRPTGKARINVSDGPVSAVLISLAPGFSG